MELVVKKGGGIRFIHDDAMAPVLAKALGVSVEALTERLRRASHVEPGPGGWWADMSPVGGERLGPFHSRTVALAAEVAWLVEHAIPVPEA